MSKKYTLRVYSIRTPKFNKRKDIEVNNKGKIKKHHFEVEVLDVFFDVLKHISKELQFINVNVPHIDEECKITFLDYEIINNTYSIATFETDKYGSIRDIKDNNSNTKNKKLNQHESVPENVKLIITRQHGLMYVTKDFNTIINKTTLNTFFNKYRYTLYNYIKTWNEVNENSGLKMYKQPAIKIDSLPSMDFFDELDMLKSIDEFSYTYDPTGSNDTPNFEDVEIIEGSNLLKKNFKETKKFKPLMGKYIVDNVKKVYEELSGRGNFDEWYVKGENQNQQKKVIKPELSTRSEQIKLNNINNLNINEVLSEIDEKLKTNNPLISKVYKLTEIKDVNWDLSDKNITDKIVKETEESILKDQKKKDGSDTIESIDTEGEDTH